MDYRDFITYDVDNRINMNSVYDIDDYIFSASTTSKPVFSTVAEYWNILLTFGNFKQASIHTFPVSRLNASIIPSTPWLSISRFFLLNTPLFDVMKFRNEQNNYKMIDDFKISAQKFKKGKELTAE